ncbi:hypothetical protein BGW39_011170 [Mortierella sp. 14UC]|nr:hypothetical protein BGW39_011170 [Mortierella sp. 14UC]
MDLSSLWWINYLEIEHLPKRWTRDVLEYDGMFEERLYPDFHGTVKGSTIVLLEAKPPRGSLANYRDGRRKPLDEMKLHVDSMLGRGTEEAVIGIQITGMRGEALAMTRAHEACYSISLLALKHNRKNSNIDLAKSLSRPSLKAHPSRYASRERGNRGGIKAKRIQYRNFNPPPLAENAGWSVSGLFRTQALACSPTSSMLSTGTKNLPSSQWPILRLHRQEIQIAETKGESDTYIVPSSGSLFKSTPSDHNHPDHGTAAGTIANFKTA